MTQLLRVQCFNVSRDGFGAGVGQSLEHPFGHADPGDLFSWAGATESWVNRTEPGGSRGLFSRPPHALSDTTFHFIDATPAEALRQAKQAADGKDVRLDGGVTTIREFLNADLVDTMHITVAPVELERGERLWTSHEELLDRFQVESVPSTSGVTHLLFWRR